MKFITVLLFTILLSLFARLTRSDSCIEYKKTSHQVSQTVYKTVYSRCGWWGWGRCKKTISSTKYKLMYQLVLACCSGYSGIECLPICESLCGTNQECSAPNTCTCVSGWEGTNCSTKTSECTNGSSSCEEGCISFSDGSYSCYCYGSNILAKDNNTCLSKVNNFKGTVGTDTLHLTWSPPTNHSSDGNLTGYNITCYEVVEMKFVTVNTNFIVSSLTPFTTYKCCIEPYWGIIGTGPLVCTENTTLEDAPSDSPHNITVTAADPWSVQIVWIPPLIPNGIITNYTIYINYTNGTDTNSRMVGNGSTIYLLEQLKVYQLVGISVSATSGGGEGPLSPYTYGRSGKVTNPQLLVNKVSDNAVNISWYPPILPGIPQDSTYDIILRNLTKEVSETSINEWMVKWDETLHVTQESLEPYIPYEVSVRGNVSNNISHGQAIMSVVFFTNESVPSFAPSWTVIERVSMTTIRLEWAELTLEESRGFVVNYSIVYSNELFPSLNISCNHSSASEIETNKTNFVMNNLNSSQRYCVAIAAVTAKGKGVLSEWSIVDIYHTQLVYFFIDHCQLWKDQVTVNQFKYQLIRKMNSFCTNCSITSDYVYNISILQCLDEVRVVKALIFFHKNQSLIQYVKKWIQQTPTIKLNETELLIRYICTNVTNCLYLTDYDPSTVTTTCTATGITTGTNTGTTTSGTIVAYMSSYSYSSIEQSPNTSTVSSTYITPLIITSVIVLFVIIAIAVSILVIIVVILKRKRFSSRNVIKDDNNANLCNPCYDGIMVVEMKGNSNEKNENMYEDVDHDGSPLVPDQSGNDKVNEENNYSFAVVLDDKSQEGWDDTLYSKCGESEPKTMAPKEESSTTYDRLRQDCQDNIINNTSDTEHCYSSLS